VVAIWRSSRPRLKTKKVAGAALAVWLKLYLPALEVYYKTHGTALATEHSLAVSDYGGFAEPVSVHLAYWHMARLGILGLILIELYSMSGDDIRTTIQQGFQRTLDTLIGLVNANPATRRPLLDIHHIQLFLLWRMLRFARRADEALAIFQDIHQRVLYRRLGQGGQRLIDQSNSWPNLLEFIATR
jgi:hypothetical protein